jgi:hypothetical protein
MDELVAQLFAASEAVRYVAIKRGDELIMRQRPNLLGASSSESDKYEERLVNPTLR